MEQIEATEELAPDYEDLGDGAYKWPLTGRNGITHYPSICEEGGFA